MCYRCGKTDPQQPWAERVKKAREATSCTQCDGFSECCTKADGVANMCAACQDDILNAKEMGTTPPSLPEGVLVT